jgi:DNA-binding protein YbaB
VTCGFKVRSIEINREIVDLDDLDMLSDLVVAAVNAALDKARKIAQDEMTKVTGGVNLPLV